MIVFFWFLIGTVVGFGVAYLIGSTILDRRSRRLQTRIRFYTDADDLLDAIATERRSDPWRPW